jgi:hypothetical protein
MTSTLKHWNTEQLQEALGSDNKWFFCEKYKRQPKDNNELILYYIENGGANAFRVKNKKGYDCTLCTPDT